MEDKQKSSVHHLDYRKHSIPSKLNFSLFSEEEIRKLSVTEICTPLTFNALGHPLPGGLYDPRLGPVSENSDPCGTCSKNVYNCSGHIGHIELVLPVVNPMFYKAIYSIIKLACLNCFTIQIKGPVKDLFIAQLRLLEEGYATEAQEAEEIVMKTLWSDKSKDYSNTVSVISTNRLEDLSGEPYHLMKKELTEYVESVLKGQGRCSGIYFSTKHIEYLKNKLLRALPQTVKTKQKCIHCQMHLQKIIVHQNRLVTTMKAADLENSEDGGDLMQSKKKINTVIMPIESRSYLRKIWENDSELMLALVPVLKYCKMEYPTDVFYFNIIPVPPPNTRPINFVDGKMMEHPQSHAFKMVITDCVILRNIIKMMKDGDISTLPPEAQTVVNAVRGNTPHEKLHQAWLELQSDVDHLMDNQLNQTTRGKESQGIKQIIEKKEGIIRMHMMGKRVNFAARTVITPDPNLSIDEIGVPEAFARTLTYPVPVTPWNVTQLRKMVLNGPNVHPGAVLVENEDGRITRLNAANEGQRASWAKKLLTSGKNMHAKGSKIVHRHLLNGDVLLLNRQPTLHRPSIMAHTVRILKGEKTFRLHYANCKAYNADFDGDEMNAHFPQNEVARSEAYNLLNVQHQYLVPKDGTPLSGLIQDHVIAGVMMSIRGRFFTKEDYCQLVCQALTNNLGDVKVLPPTILKPVKLWSGKQIISTVLISIIPKGRHPPNLHSSAKISDKAFVQEQPRPWLAGGEPFKNPKTMSEAEVVIRQGELLCGVLDKMHYGATPYGLVHCLYELYGGSCSSKLLSAFSKLFTAYLQKEGFTLGVEDIIVTKKADKKRVKIIKKVRQVGEEALRSALELPEVASAEELEQKMEETLADKLAGRAIIDSSYKSKLDSFTNEINKLCLSTGLLKKFPQNNLQLMIQSGAKGSTVNSMQISCLLGQIELEGRRPPLMISGKSLPSFIRFDPQPRAGGFVDGRFMTGIRPQEFFFHCMAGREGLIDTAVKTSRSGYLQRCLVKHLEGLVVGYDMAVRDSDGSVIQFCYGEDGRDVMKATFLRKEQMPFLAENHKAIASLPVESMKDPETFDEIEKLRKKVKKWESHNDTALSKRKTSPFCKFSANLKKEFAFSSDMNKVQRSTGRTKLAEILCQKWQEATEDTRNRYMKKIHCPDPVTSKFQSQSNFGAITEQLEKLMRDYLSSNPGQDKTEFRNMMCIKSMQTLCSPGEPVGLLAAQSIGEPSTQMTLNTFHFAGRGEMNVTLGIPRLREILMTASKSIKTPNMDIPFYPHIKNLEKKAKELQLKLTRVCVADVLERVSVVTRLELHSRQYSYTIRFQFLPHGAYKSQFYVTPPRILHHMEKYFFREFLLALKKLVKLKFNIVESGSETKGIKSTNADDELDVGPQDGEGEQEESTKKGKKSRTEKNEDNSEEEEEEGDDEDATMARIRTRQGEALEYEEPEEEEIEVEKIEEDDEDIDNNNKTNNEESIPMDETATELPDENEEDEDLSIHEEDNLSSITSAARCSKVINSVPYVNSYHYDTAKELWCEVVFGFPVAKKRMDLTDLLKDVAQKSVVWEVPSIKRAVTYINPDTSRLTLKTDGINFMEMFKFSNLLDLNKLYSNDIHHMAETYGIEAARYVIVKEIQDVFKVYGITVDPRHLLLVADYMTSNGTYEPFNRKGIECNASPLQQMTFESSINFLRSAIFNGKQDDLRSPSSRLMVGQPCACGTGAFSLLQKLQIPAELHL